METTPLPVLVRQEMGDGVVLLRLQRPQVRNALNLELRRALAATFTEMDTRADVRCIVITGDDKAFCAGADLREYVDADAAEVLSRRMDLLWGAIASCTKPVVAAVMGHALGGGCELAMHADIIVAGMSARFGQPEVRIGLIPGGGATQRLPRAVGKAAAMQMVLSGRPIDATRALALGLVSEVVPDDHVLDRAVELARDIAAQPPLAVQQAKQMLLLALNTPLDAGLRAERQAFALMFAAPDKTERLRAFLR